MGFCEQKFKENIVVENIKLYDLKIGTKIKINDAILQITQVGKDCFGSDVCDIAKITNNCPLKLNVIFAKTVNSGIININDQIEILE